ncbi:hypothetical protein GCM10009583_16720 [Ornithinicoccus hortensis]
MSRRAVCFGGEQVGAGVQGASGGVERVALAAAVPAGLLLDSAAAVVHRLPGQLDYVERIHDADRVGQFLGGGRFEAGEPVHGHDLDVVAPGLVPGRLARS